MINKNPQEKAKLLTGNNQLMITLNPFDNFFKFTIFKNENDEVIKHNLNDFTDIKMTIKASDKDYDFKVYRESSENDFENGVVVFRIPESYYIDLKNLSLTTNVFYINGVDLFNNRQIIYTGFFSVWDSKTNVSKLQSNFLQSNRISNSVKTQIKTSDDKKNQVNNAINTGTNKPKSSPKSQVPVANKKINEEADIKSFKPRYRAVDYATAISVAPSKDEKLAYKILDSAQKSSLNESIKRANNLGLKSHIDAGFQNRKEFIDQIEAYFKGLDILPNETVIDTWNKSSILQNDLKKFILNKSLNLKDVIAGEFKPLTQKQKNYFGKSNIPLFVKGSKPKGSERPTVKDGIISTTNTENEGLKSQITGTGNDMKSNFNKNGTSVSGSKDSGPTQIFINGRLLKKKEKGNKGGLKDQLGDSARKLSSLMKDSSGGQRTSMKDIFTDDQSKDNKFEIDSKTVSKFIDLEAYSGVEITIRSLSKLFSDKTVKTDKNGIFNFGRLDKFPGDIVFIVKVRGKKPTEFDFNAKEIKKFSKSPTGIILNLDEGPKSRLRKGFENEDTLRDKFGDQGRLSDKFQRGGGGSNTDKFGNERGGLNKGGSGVSKGGSRL
jgi:hypothetical protein